MDWFLVAGAALYAAVLFGLRWGVGKAERDGTRSSAFPQVSIVIAARNEAQHIEACLRSVLAQDYPRGRLEIIVVDDRSEDGTSDIAESLAAEIPRHPLRILRIDSPPPGVAPKKHALRTGIEASCGEILLTTDADCRPPEGWVQTMVQHFDDATGMVIGFSPLTAGHLPRWEDALHRLDSLALATVAAGSAGLGFPLTCSGRNLAFRKEVFLEVDGYGPYASLPSGDDDLFLTRVRDKTAWKIRYCFDPNSFVPAYPVRGLRPFWNQRVRHASKGLVYPRPVRWGLGALYAFNLCFLVAMCHGLITGRILPFACAWILKSASELALLERGARALKFRAPLWIVPLVSPLHALYVSVFGAAGQLARFEWKGRIYRTESRPEA